MRQTPRPLPPDPRLDQALRLAVAAGALLTLVLPWRSQWLGLTLLWLLAMPLSAWWALHRFRLPAPRFSADPSQFFTEPSGRKGYDARTEGVDHTRSRRYVT